MQMIRGAVSLLENGTIRLSLHIYPFFGEPALHADGNFSGTF